MLKQQQTITKYRRKGLAFLKLNYLQIITFSFQDVTPNRKTVEVRSQSDADLLREINVSIIINTNCLLIRAIISRI